MNPGVGIGGVFRWIVSDIQNPKLPKLHFSFNEIQQIPSCWIKDKSPLIKAVQRNQLNTLGSRLANNQNIFTLGRLSSKEILRSLRKQCTWIKSPLPMNP